MRIQRNSGMNVFLFRSGKEISAQTVEMISWWSFSNSGNILKRRIRDWRICHCHYVTHFWIRKNKRRLWAIVVVILYSSIRYPKLVDDSGEDALYEYLAAPDQATKSKIHFCVCDKLKFAFEFFLSCRRRNLLDFILNLFPHVMPARVLFKMSYFDRWR